MKKTIQSNKAQPWKTDDWFVSPWNFLENVTKDFKPPKEVKIHDITLRDGEQQAGIIWFLGKQMNLYRVAAQLYWDDFPGHTAVKAIVRDSRFTP